MKIIDCDKKKKNKESEIYIHIKKLLEKIKEDNFELDKDIKIETIFENIKSKYILYMKSFLYDVDIMLTIFKIKNENKLRLCLNFKYMRKKKRRVVQIIDEFIEEIESVLSYIDQIKIISENLPDTYFIDIQRNI